MLSALLRRSANDVNDVTDEEVFEKVRQMQATDLEASSIPQFYFGPSKVAKDSVAYHLRRVVQRKQAEERIAEVTELLDALQEHSDAENRISYAELNKIIDEKNLNFSPFNFPGVFLRQHEAYSRVCTRTLIDELQTRRWPLKLSVRLMHYDSDADGYLTLPELQQWLSDFAGSQERCADECKWPIPASLRPKWLAIAPRKVMFLLGQNNLVPIDKLVQHEMMHPLEHYSPSDYGDNLDWFGPKKAGQVWQKFSDLDGDGDGLLSEQEVGAVRPFFSGGQNLSTMAPYFLQRVWEVHVTSISPIDKQPAMSLEEFADFLLAWQHRGQPTSCRYFFKVFDIEHTGRLSGTVISKWCHTVVEHCHSIGNPMSDEDYNPEDFRNEVFDFVKPANGNFITWEDLCKSEPTGDHPSTLDVCGILCDAQCLLQHCSQ